MRFFLVLLNALSWSGLASAALVASPSDLEQIKRELNSDLPAPKDQEQTLELEAASESASFDRLFNQKSQEGPLTISYDEQVPASIKNLLKDNTIQPSVDFGPTFDEQTSSPLPEPSTWQVLLALIAIPAIIWFSVSKKKPAAVRIK